MERMSVDQFNREFRGGGEHRKQNHSGGPCDKLESDVPRRGLDPARAGEPKDASHGPQRRVSTPRHDIAISPARRCFNREFS